MAESDFPLTRFLLFEGLLDSSWFSYLATIGVGISLIGY
jgi:hypothetical protein